MLALATKPRNTMIYKN